LNAWLLLKMKDNSWVAGLWGAEDEGGAALDSYASGYPESQELYFSDTAVVDGDGAVTVDETGRPKPTGMGVLVRWDEVAYAYLGADRRRGEEAQEAPSRRARWERRLHRWAEDGQ
jgi:hypothetical protein